MALHPYRRNFWRSAFDDMFHEMDQLDRSIAPYWRMANRDLHTGNHLNEVINDKDKFAVSLDVSHFRPDEMTVKVDGRLLTVEASQEEKSEHGYMQRSFVRRYTLPDDVDVNAIKSGLSNDGHLTIEAAKTGQETSRNIPIMHVRGGEEKKAIKE